MSTKGFLAAELTGFDNGTQGATQAKNVQCGELAERLGTEDGYRNRNENAKKAQEKETKHKALTPHASSRC